jgi:hypothetical protein
MSNERPEFSFKYFSSNKDKVMIFLSELNSVSLSLFLFPPGMPTSSKTLYAPWVLHPFHGHLFLGRIKALWTSQDSPEEHSTESVCGRGRGRGLEGSRGRKREREILKSWLL